jgi:hypothetical protein
MDRSPQSFDVDLVSRRAINPRLRGKILHDARPLYAA